MTHPLSFHRKNLKASERDRKARATATFAVQDLQFRFERRGLQKLCGLLLRVTWRAVCDGAYLRSGLLSSQSSMMLSKRAAIPHRRASKTHSFLFLAIAL
jgi:hypothetical protein